MSELLELLELLELDELDELLELLELLELDELEELLELEELVATTLNMLKTHFDFVESLTKLVSLIYPENVPSSTKY